VISQQLLKQGLWHWNFVQSNFSEVQATSIDHVYLEQYDDVAGFNTSNLTHNENENYFTWIENMYVGWSEELPRFNITLKGTFQLCNSLLLFLY